MAAELLPDELWIEIEPLLPPPPPPSPKGGRPPVDNQAALKGILFVLRFGIPWQALPYDLFGVSGSSCWRRFAEWTEQGVWQELHRRVLNRLGKAGGIDHAHGVVDSASIRALKGGAHRPEPHRPRQTGLQTPRPDRGRGRAAGGADHAGERARPVTTRALARRFADGEQATGSPASQAGRDHRRPRLRHRPRDRHGRIAWDQEPSGGAVEPGPWQRAGGAALRGGANAGVLRALPEAEVVLRTLGVALSGLP